MKIVDAYRLYSLDKDPSFSAFYKISNFDKNAEIFIVVLTGGPCAGKTTTLNKALRQSIAIPNCEVFVAQEAADHIKKGNMNFVSAGCDSTFQRFIINHQLTSEQMVVITAIKHKIMHPEDRAICIFDRSIMDGEAYFKKPSEYAEILKDYGLTAKSVYERSDMVVYLRSAAIGAEHAYTTSDGTKRDESIEEAALRDTKVYKAWKKHKNFVEIDNTFRFNEKLDMAISKIFGVAGISIPVKTCRRFIIRTPDQFILHNTTSHHEVFWDKTFFLNSHGDNDLYRSIRIRTGGRTVTYHYCEQRWGKVQHPGKHRMTEEAVYDTTFQTSDRFVLDSLMDIDPHINSIQRMVNTFYMLDDIYCELSVFECSKEYAYLRVFFDCEDEMIEDYVESIMDTFQVVREVTYERKYCEYEIARTQGEVFTSISG